MTGTQIERLEFRGASEAIPATLLIPPGASPQLAVALPGAGYTCREPLLRYSIMALLKKGFRVLALDKIYADDPSWMKLHSESDARRIVEEDAVAVFKAIPERLGTLPQTIVARSLGTYALACVLERKLIHPQQIVWQTPALAGKWPIMRSCGIRGFGVLGTEDRYFKDAFPHLPEDRIVVEGADHGMEIPFEALRSIDILRQVTEATERWLISP